MAKTGQHKITWIDTLNYGYALTFNWTSTTDDSTNSSTVNWNLNLYSEGGIVDVSQCTYGITIEGNTYTGKVPKNLGVDESVVVTSGTLVIPHNPDGTRTFSFSYNMSWWKIHFKSGTNPANGTSGIGELERINREPVLISSSNFTDEDNPTITYSNVMGEDITSLQACIATEDGSSTIIAYRDISKTGTSYTFNFTESERTQLRLFSNTSTTARVRFYIKSVISGTTYHSYSAVRKLTIANAQPTITAGAMSNTTTSNNLTGGANKIIRGFNTVLCTLTATGQKNATIVEQTITCGANTRSGSSTVFENVETNTFVFKAKDSRGLVTTKTITLPMINYIKPTCNQTVTMVMESSSTTQAEFTATGNYFNDNFGAANNTIKLESRRRDNGGSWSDWADISILINDISNNTYTASGNMSGLDASGTYEFQFRVTDEIMTVESTTGTFTLLPIFDWSKTDFNFNVPVTIQGGLVHDYVIETGTEAMGSNGTWYWSKWKSGRAECYGCRNYGNMGVSTAWGSLYKSSTFGQDLPSGLFATKPETMLIQVREAGSSCWISSQIGWAPDETTTGGFAVTSPVSGTISQVYISFNIIGRWK